MAEINVSNKAIKLSKATFLAMDKGYWAYKNKHGKEYPVVHLNQTTKRGQYIVVAKFKEMRTRWINFRRSHEGRRPNYIWIVHPTTSQVVETTPEVKEVDNPNIFFNPRFIRNLKQKTLYYCAPTMIEQLIYELYGIVTDQYEIAKLAGTTTAGTGHPGVEKGFEVKVFNLGHKADITYQTFSGLGSTALARWKKVGEMVEDPNIGIGLHILYRLKWGHYITPVYINLETEIIGFVDTLNEEDIMYVPFSTMELWIAKTTGGQPSVVKAVKIN